MTSPLVSAAWLREHLHDADLRVVDVRWYLSPSSSGKRGADEYARGHVPGAVFADLDRDLAGPPAVSAETGPGRHPLPSPEAFARVLARLGVTQDTVVVAYDDAGGSVAARLWWMLRWCGQGKGHVLDGGLAAWIAAGGELTTEVPVIPPTPPAHFEPNRAMVVDKRAVDRLRSAEGALVLDARATERFEGRVEPVDARPGHIPGARSAPFVESLAAPGGVFRSREELARRFASLGADRAKTVVCYCGSGVTACHDLLALALTGREDALLYEGSWSDWARDPSLPAATGPAGDDP
jgi:thiosulfate/3-mercaptopyruvate sulfurtransferase